MPKLFITIFLLLTLKAAAGLIDDLPETAAKALTHADKVIVYKEADSKKLEIHLYLPKGLKKGEKRPLILFIHGGGWRGGNPAVHAFESLYFSQRGMVTATISYRLLNKQTTSPAACLSDARDALTYLRKNAEQYNIDPEKILTCGGSAGGHLASALSTMADENWTEENFPNAMILLYPAMDLVNGWKGGAAACKKAKIDLKSFSPLYNISKHTAPTLILSGEKDTIVNPQSARKFIDKLKEHGTFSRYIEYKGKGHKLFERHRKDPHFRATINYMESFLNELGWLKETLSPKANIQNVVYE